MDITAVQEDQEYQAEPGFLSRPPGGRRLCNGNSLVRQQLPPNGEAVLSSLYLGECAELAWRPHFGHGEIPYQALLRRGPVPPLEFVLDLRSECFAVPSVGSIN